MQLPQAVTALSALGNGHRLAIFRLLVRAGPAGIAAGEVSREVGLLPNTLSTHLAALVHAGLAQSRRAGRSVLYSADYAAIRALLGYLMDDCCGGRPEICAALPEVLPNAACAPLGPLEGASR